MNFKNCRTMIGGGAALLVLTAGCGKDGAVGEEPCKDVGCKIDEQVCSPRSNVCVNRGYDEAPCTTNDDCESSYLCASDGVCVIAGRRGAPCETRADCDGRTNSCVRGVCAEAAALGERCTEAEQCAQTSLANYPNAVTCAKEAGSTEGTCEWACGLECSEGECAPFTACDVTGTVCCMSGGGQQACLDADRCAQ